MPWVEGTMRLYTGVGLVSLLCAFASSFAESAVEVSLFPMGGNGSPDITILEHDDAWQRGSFTTREILDCAEAKLNVVDHSPCEQYVSSQVSVTHEPMGDGLHVVNFQYERYRGQVVFGKDETCAPLRAEGEGAVAYMLCGKIITWPK